MADHLPIVEDQTPRIGENADHGQQDQRTGSMHGGLLEMGLEREGLKYFAAHPPAAPTQFVDEVGRDRT